MTQHLTHCGLPEGMTRWQFFGLIEAARQQLGLSKGAIAYLKVSISNTMDEDFAAGRICSFWTSVTKIAARAGLDRRQVARIEAWLIGNGFLIKTASDHSRRGGSRKNGIIGHEFGINLAPLIARAAEIQAAAKKAAFEEAESERLRSQIKRLFGNIRRLRLDVALAAAEEILPNRRPSTVTCFDRLKRVAEALEAVWEEFSAEDSRGEMSYQCDNSPPPNTYKENKPKTCKSSAQSKSQPLQLSPAVALRLASPAFREIIELYAQGGFGGPPCWRNVELAAQERAYQLGITLRTWRRQCQILGSERAALCLLVADHNAGRTDRFQVENAGGAFINMVRSEARHSAVLDRLLGELIDFSMRSQR